MQLNDQDANLLASVTDALETRQHAAVLREGDVPTSALQRLLASEVPDLPPVGLYALSRRQPDFVALPEGMKVELLYPFVEHPASAWQIARFLAAELTAPEAEHIATRSPLASPALARGFQDMMASSSSASAGPGSGQPRVTDMTIIVHGTWAASYNWWQPNGTFWTHVDNITHNVYGASDFYSWSGANQHSDRVNAAHDLRAWVRNHPAQNLDVIAHSHGGNVCLLASRLGVKIRKLILLGTPVRLEYLPDLGSIETLHNVFSTGDRVQTPAGTIPNRRAEGRTFADGTSITNHRAENDGNGHTPGHSDLHEPATWSASDLDDLL